MWLRVEHEIEKPTRKLQSPISLDEKPTTKLQNPSSLDSDAFIAEVRKVRGKKKPLSVAAVRSLRDEHASTIVPAQGWRGRPRGLSGGSAIW